MLTWFYGIVSCDTVVLAKKLCKYEKYIVRLEWGKAKYLFWRSFLRKIRIMLLEHKLDKEFKQGLMLSMRFWVFVQICLPEQKKHAIGGIKSLKSKNSMLSSVQCPVQYKKSFKVKLMKRMKNKLPKKAASKNCIRNNNSAQRRVKQMNNKTSKSPFGILSKILFKILSISGELPVLHKWWLAFAFAFALIKAIKRRIDAKRNPKSSTQKTSCSCASKSFFKFCEDIIDCILLCLH